MKDLGPRSRELLNEGGNALRGQAGCERAPGYGNCGQRRQASRGSGLIRRHRGDGLILNCELNSGRGAISVDGDDHRMPVP